MGNDRAKRGSRVGRLGLLFLLVLPLFLSCELTSGIIPSLPATQTPFIILVTVIVTTTPAPLATPVPTVAPVVTPAPTRTPSSKPTPKPTPVPEPTPALTVMPTEAVVMKYGPPKLIDPINGQHIDGAAYAPVLTWEPVRRLAADEYYDVSVRTKWQGEDRWFGSDWTKEVKLQLPFEGVVGNSDENRFEWWVTVKRLTGYGPAGEKQGTPISPESEHWFFEWYP